ncbi:MAG: efflux RND transporter periplasmic adaptor subunit [Candidatus Gracilibacteria bacterium]|nr:efflux RND transporter periplasmic adaptor subunit [Candidatus Gracilibacteria bacterium]
MKKIISIIILPSFLLFSCAQKDETITQKDEIIKKYAKTEVLALKPFSEELKLTGKIAGIQETTISSQVSGNVKQVKNKVGDKVKAGDVLATIDTTTNLLSTNLNTVNNTYSNTLDIYDLTKESIQKDLESAQMQLENTITTRDNTYASTEEQLKIAQTQLDNINVQGKNTMQMTNTSLDLAQKSLDTAILNLENFEKNYTQTIDGLEVKKQNLLKNINTTITSSSSNIDSVLTYADTILGVSDANKNLNDSYEIYLSAKDTTIKTKAENDWRNAKALYDDFTKSNLSDLDKLNNLLDITNKTIILYEDLVKISDNSIVSSSFSDSSLSTMKTTIKTNQSVVLGVKSGLVSLQNSWDDLASTISSTKTNLETSKISLNQAITIAQASLVNTQNSTNTNLDTVAGNKTLLENQLKSTIANIKTQRDNLDNAVKIAQNTYNSTKAKLDASLAGVKSQLAGVSGQKNSLLQQVDNTIIKAPFDGIITSKNIEVGTLVNPGTPVFAISKNGTKIVKSDLNSDNIKFIKVGQEVLISKNGLSSTGTISLVSASADNITKMYNVEVKILNNDFSKKMVLGDYVDVYLKKDLGNLNNQIIIPFSSLITGSSGEFYVYLVGSGNILKSQIIKIGETNSNELVVEDGLKVGDKIVTSGTLNLSEGDIIE